MTSFVSEPSASARTARMRTKEGTTMAGILDALDWQGKVFSSGWVSAHGGVLDSVEPATGEVLAQAGLADARDIAAAAAAAKAAQPGWAAQPGPQRAAVPRRASRVPRGN